jgi:preprotein translocase subunit SecE
VVGAIAAFAFAWRQGYLLRVSNYCQETWAELKKCSWPTWEELKGSTVLVSITLGLLGLFTYAVDYIFIHVVFWISKV